MKVTHTFEPVYDERSRILMLGTMPSPKSREQGFYYGHPRNRFWSILADVCEKKHPETIEEKTALALSCHIAVWDVLKCCEIHGADDSSIQNPEPNDLSVILDAAPINAVFTTGSKAFELYRRYCYPLTGIEAVKLPSTSPANCRMSYEELKNEYMKIRQFI